MTAIHHERLRIGCSKLNNHLFKELDVINSPACSCGYTCEDPDHFFFACPLFAVHRVQLLQSLSTVQNITVQKLLYGDPSLTLESNNHIFGAVHLYIMNTQRFE